MNGTVGKVIGFMTTMEAAKHGIKVGVVETPQKPQLSTRAAGPQGNTEGNSDPAVWPLVRFIPSNAEVLCVPNSFEVNNAEGTVEARRDQVRWIVLIIETAY